MLALEKKHFECEFSGVHLTLPKQASPMALASQPQSSRDTVVMTLPGSELLTKESAMMAIERAMSFPSYFGRNWEALRDCLTDLSWIESSVVVLVINQAEVLQTDSEVVRKLHHCFIRAIEYWRDPWDIGEIHRNVSRFHILLRAESSALAALQAHLGDAICGAIPCPFIWDH